MKSQRNALLIATTLVFYWLLYFFTALLVKIEQLNLRIERLKSCDSWFTLNFRVSFPSLLQFRFANFLFRKMKSYVLWMWLKIVNAYSSFDLAANFTWMWFGDPINFVFKDKLIDLGDRTTREGDTEQGVSTNDYGRRWRWVGANWNWKRKLGGGDNNFHIWWRKSKVEGSTMIIGWYKEG